MNWQPIETAPFDTPILVGQWSKVGDGHPYFADINCCFGDESGSTLTHWAYLNPPVEYNSKDLAKELREKAEYREEYRRKSH